MKPTFYVILLFLPTMLSAQSLKEIEDRLRGEIERTEAAFKTAIARLEARKKTLIDELKNLKAQAEELRNLLDGKASQLRRLSRSLQELQKRLREQEEEIEGLKKRVPRVWAAVEEASSVVFPVTIRRGGGLKELLDALWELWSSGAKAALLEEEVICRDGTTSKARIFRLGRIGRVWVTEDGRVGLGAVSPESPTRWEDVEVDGEMAAQIKELFMKMESGAEVIWVPVDAARRVTARGLRECVGTWEQLKRGGVVMIPIGVVGLVGLILCVVVGLRLGKKNLRVDIEGTPAARVKKRLLNYKDVGSAKMHEVLTECVEEELVRLERGLGAVGVCASVAPLLGLLGTVVGMIRTFETIASYGAQDARLLAGGIREALITTEAGLAVAIPLLLLHALLRGRAESLAEHLREQGERLIIDTVE